MILCGEHTNVEKLLLWFWLKNNKKKVM